MRIAYLLPDHMPYELRANGAQTQQTGIIEGLRKRGHHVSVMWPSDSGVITGDEPHSSLALHSQWVDGRPFELASKGAWRLQQLMGVPYLNVFRNIKSYAYYLRLLGSYDAVFVRNGLHREAGALACRRLRVPSVLFFDADPFLEEDFAGSPITGLLHLRARKGLEFCLSATDRVICVCDAARRQLESDWSVDPARIVVMPNGVDVEHHRPRPELRRQTRACLHIADEPLVVFVGAFYPWHDLETLLHAFRLILERDGRTKLLLVGDGDTRQRAEDLARGLAVSDSTIFTGRVDHQNIPSLLSAADVAVAPYPRSDVEFWGSPMKIYEYMACGCAIVATSVGQLKQVIQDGTNGILAPPGDPQALAAAIQRLLVNPPLRSRIGIQARNDALSEHSWDGYALQLESVFEGIARTERKR